MAKPRVLIAEDDDSLRLVVEMQLRLGGTYLVTGVADGRSALDAATAEESSFDVVVLDLDLPIRTGVEVIDELRRRRPHLLTRVIVVTGGDADRPPASTIRPDVHCVLTKPVSTADLREAVAAVLRHTNWPDQAATPDV